MQQVITDMEQKNMVGVVDAMPARKMNHYSGIVGMNSDQFRSRMFKQMSDTMAAFIIQYIEILLSDLDVTDAQNADGTNAIFAKIPYAMLMSLKVDEIKSTSTLVAVYEGEKWGLIRIDPTKTAQLIGLDPFLKDVNF